MLINAIICALLSVPASAKDGPFVLIVKRGESIAGGPVILDIIVKQIEDGRYSIIVPFGGLGLRCSHFRDGKYIDLDSPHRLLNSLSGSGRIRSEKGTGLLDYRCLLHRYSPQLPAGRQQIRVEISFRYNRLGRDLTPQKEEYTAKLVVELSFHVQPGTTDVIDGFNKRFREAFARIANDRERRRLIGMLDDVRDPKFAPLLEWLFRKPDLEFRQYTRLIMGYYWIAEDKRKASQHFLELTEQTTTPALIVFFRPWTYPEGTPLRPDEIRRLMHSKNDAVRLLTYLHFAQHYGFWARVNLFVAIARYRAPTRSVLDKAVRDLDDTSFRKREQASQLLHRIGEGALPFLREAASATGSSEVQERLTKIIKSIEEQGPDPLDREIVNLLKESDKEAAIEIQRAFSGTCAHLWIGRECRTLLEKKSR